MASEAFYLVWLNESGNSSTAHANIDEQLRKVTDRVKIFSDENECEAYLRSVSDSDRIVWIINDHLGQTMVSRLHSLKQISSIYIYGSDGGDEWTKDYAKVSE